jgi:hypothetical protein
MGGDVSTPDIAKRAIDRVHTDQDSSLEVVLDNLLDLREYVLELIGAIREDIKRRDSEKGEPE